MKARRFLRSYLSDKQESRFFLAVSEVSTIAGNEFFALLFILIAGFVIASLFGFVVLFGLINLMIRSANVRDDFQT